MAPAQARAEDAAQLRVAQPARDKVEDVSATEALGAAEDPGAVEARNVFLASYSECF